MQHSTLANTWGLPLPKGVTIQTSEARESIIVLCQNEAQYRSLFNPPQPGHPTPAQRICSRAAISPVPLKYFCVKVGKSIVGHLEIATLEGCMELNFKNKYPILDDEVLIQYLKKPLDDGRSFGIVHMSSNISLFSSSNIGKFSKCGEAKNMHGADVSQWWPEASLKKFVEDLETAANESRGLINYQYKARDWQLQTNIFTVNAQLWWYRGDIVRLTETLNAEPVIVQI
jgi:hypothetical protein